MRSSRPTAGSTQSCGLTVPTQVLHIDDEGLIRRHDYTALDFGRLARASQEVDQYRQFGGMAVATRRRVRPSLWPHRPLAYTGLAGLGAEAGINLLRARHWIAVSVSPLDDGRSVGITRRR